MMETKVRHQNRLSRDPYQRGIKTASSHYNRRNVWERDYDILRPKALRQFDQAVDFKEEVIQAVSA